MPMELQLFAGDEEVAVSATAPESPAEGASEEQSEEPLVVYGRQEDVEEEPQEVQGNPNSKDAVNVQTEDLNASFNELIHGKYAEQYKAAVERNLSQRFKEREADRALANENAQLRAMLAERYDLDGSDYKSIVSALEDDESPAEREAYEEGKTKAEIRAERILKREEKRKQEEQARQEMENQRRAEVQKWSQEGMELRNLYKDFDLVAELRNDETGERFLRYLRGGGMSVKEAYEAVHHDEILKNLMTATAGEVSRKTVEDIRARGMRPAEAGNGKQRKVIYKDDPSEFTAQDIANVMAKVRAGQKIRF